MNRKIKKDNSIFENRWRQRFRQYANQFDDDAGIAGWSPTGLKTRLRNFSRVLDDSINGDFWLDAGCGAGSYARYLESKGCEVIGVDYSIESVAKAKSRSSDKLLWASANVKELPFKENTFNHAMCFGVLQALTESELAISALVRVVKPGGTIWVDALNLWCLPHLLQELRRVIKRRPQHLRYESAKNICKAFNKNNVEYVKIYWLPILPRRFVRYQWLLETTIFRAILKYIPLIGMLISHSVLIVGKRR